MLLKRIHYLDGRTDRICGVDIVGGWSTESVSNEIIGKIWVMGDGSKFEVIEEEYVPKRELDELADKYGLLLKAKKV